MWGTDVGRGPRYAMGGTDVGVLGLGERAGHQAERGGGA